MAVVAHTELSKLLKNMVAQISKKKQPLYFPWTLEEWKIMTKALTHAQLKVLGYIRAACGPWGDREIQICVKDLANELELDRSTVSRALNHLSKEQLIDIELIRVGVRVSAVGIKGYRSSNYASTSCDRHAQECDRHAQECDRHAQECDRHAQLSIYKYSSNYSNPQTAGDKNFDLEITAQSSASLQNRLEALYDEANNMGRGKSSAPVEFCQQNVTVEAASGPVKFHQEDIKVETHGGPVEFHQEDIKVETHGGPVEFRQEDIKVETHGGQVEFRQEDIKVETHGGPVEFHQEDIKVETHGGPVEFHQEDITVETHGGPVSFRQGNVCVSNFPAGLERIPRTLLERLKALRIPLDERVVGALKEAHQSQIMGALNHVENNFRDIASPRGVFLFQVRKQPIENLGPRQPVVTAADFDVKDIAPPSENFKSMLAAIAEKKKMKC